MRTTLALAVVLAGCEGTSRPVAWLSDPQSAGLLAKLAEAEIDEAAPAQAQGTNEIVALASRFVDDETATLYAVQQLGVELAPSVASEEAASAGREEQIEIAQLEAAALDAYFRPHERAAHRSRIAVVVHEVLTRCRAASICDRARAYVLLEQGHLKLIR